jgi:hypothetical protein
LHATQAGTLRVAVNDQDVGHWRYPSLPGEWLETYFVAPADAVVDERTEVRLALENQDGAYQDYAPYYFWAFQGEPTAFEPTPDHRLEAQLGESIALIGYDLHSTAAARPMTFVPGESIPLVLYWRAVAAPTVDAKAFVHLYDESGEIVTQQDRRPYHGTRPPYTWSAGEILDDPYVLQLPADLRLGRYVLAIGMYDPTTALRLPVQTTEEHRLSDERILLEAIQVTTGTE